MELSFFKACSNINFILMEMSLDGGGGGDDDI